MAIFSTKTVVATESAVEHVEYNVQPTMEASDAILYEFAEDMYKIQAGLYISDVMIEQAVAEGAAPEALVEGAIGDFFKKIGAAIKKLWDKVVAWFKAVAENVKVLFTSGEAFVKKYEKVIKEKKDNGFTYVGYKYSEVKANVNDVDVSKITDALGKLDAKSTKDDLPASVKELVDIDEAEFKRTLCTVGEVRADSISEMKSDLVKMARSNMVVAKELTFSSGNSKDEMINVIKNHKELMTTIKNGQDKMNKEFGKLLKTVKGLESKFKENTDLTGVISTLTGKAKFAVSVAQAVSASKISVEREMYREYLATLKKFVMWKPAKESAEVVETGSKSILESAMELL